VRVLTNVVGAPDDRAPQARRVADVSVVVHDRALEVRIRLHHDVGAEHGVGREHGSGFDPGVVADEHRAVDDRIGRDLDGLTDPHALAHLEAGQVELHLTVEQVLVRGAVRLEGADVFPVAVDDGSEQRQPALEHGREHVTGEVTDLAVGDEVEDSRVEHVDAGVDRVREHLTPRRLLQEALDATVGPGDDDAEVDRILDPLQRDRRERLLRLVPFDNRAEIDVGEHVAGDHEERLVELGHRVAHRTRGSERCLFGCVTHPDPELGTVTEVGADVIRHERDGHDDVVEPVAREQLDDVLHHRHVRDGHHRLRLVTRERPQTRALTAGHDHSLHAPTSSRAREARPSRSAARAAGM
jgi:hypothetical protein